MINYLLKLSKKIFFYILIFLSLVIFVELFFGYWFDKDNFGPYMREHRMKKTLYSMKKNGKTYKFANKRNYYGFRGDELDPSEINGVMVGGSTTAERYKPEKFTIVSLLNKKFNKENINIKIANAGIEGQSTLGHIANFKYWFPKLNKFNPEFIIFYVGINDVFKNVNTAPDALEIFDAHDGFILNPDKNEVFKDNIRSRSIIYDSLRRIKHKFYEGNEKKRITLDFDNLFKKNLKKKYLNFEQKTKTYNVENILENYDKEIRKYIDNIDELAKYSQSIGAIPIFVNQAAQRTYITKELYALNISLINHCKKQNYKCVNLAKKINATSIFWWDGIHTTPETSKKIAEIIFPELKSFLEIN